jgi:hypothetical protein
LPETQVPVTNATDSRAASPVLERKPCAFADWIMSLLAMPAGREADARKFYQELLGIPEATKPPEFAARGGCWFESEEVKVHSGVEKNFAPARKAHPAFIVDDLAGLTLVLKNAGYAIAHDKPLEGYDRIFVDNPFGNRIELMEVKPS